MVKEYGLVVDLERCIGCRTCTIACKVEHGIEVGSGIRVETVGSPHEDTPAGEYPNLSMTFTPVTCMQCRQPACLDACPTEAICQRADGIVLIDEGKCNGCQVCLPACPYGAWSSTTSCSLPRKCNLCSERLDRAPTILRAVLSRASQFLVAILRDLTAWVASPSTREALTCQA